MGNATSQRHGGGDLHQGTGNGDFADRQKIANRKMHPDTEHQKNDADFRQLRSELGVRNEAWRKRSNRYAGKKIAKKRRQMQSARNVTANQGVNQAGGHSRDEGNV